MERITKKHLQVRIDYLNRLTGNPESSYKKDENGRMQAQIGNYHIDQAYGGYALHQMMSEGGGIHDPFRSGHMPARELLARIDAYIDGIMSERK